MQDVVLTCRQIPGGWPSYEKGTATTCYRTPGGFGKSLFTTLGWVGFLVGVKTLHPHQEFLMRMQC